MYSFLNEHFEDNVKHNKYMAIGQYTAITLLHIKLQKTLTNKRLRIISFIKEPFEDVVNFSRCKLSFLIRKLVILCISMLRRTNRAKVAPFKKIIKNFQIDIIQYNQYKIK